MPTIKATIILTLAIYLKFATKPVYTSAISWLLDDNFLPNIGITPLFPAVRQMNRSWREESRPLKPILPTQPGAIPWALVRGSVLNC